MKQPHWFIILAGLICYPLVIIGALVPPMNAAPLFEVIAYEIVVSFGVSLLLILINERGLPEKKDPPITPLP